MKRSKVIVGAIESRMPKDGGRDSLGVLTSLEAGENTAWVV